jgi:hypothetical protein
MMSSAASYSEIDPALNNWADRRNVEWIHNDRDWDVRTLYWPLARPESVQLWLDEPADGKVTVHVCHNTTKGGQRHMQERATFGDLDQVLDRFLAEAQSLVAELKERQ